jgi:type I restriction enzyme S subunit
MMEKQLIPAGYKQTEVGVTNSSGTNLDAGIGGPKGGGMDSRRIPVDWTLSQLGNIATFSQGTQVGLEKQIKTDKEGYVRFIRIENYTQLSDDFRYIPKNEGSGKFIQKDDVAVVRYGATAGFIGTGVDGILANNLFKVSPNEKIIGKSFLYVYLKSDVAFKYFQDSMSGGAMPALSFKIVSNMTIVLPNRLEEQTAIANALSDVDALIAALEKLINKKSAIKTAAMQQLLTGKKRLPPFDQLNTGYKQTELGEIPGDWEVASLGNVGESIIGLTYSPRDVSDFGSLVLRSSNVQNNRLAFDDNVFVSMDLPDRVIVREGDILICVRNGSRQLIGKCALIDAKTSGSAFGAFMSIYRSQSSQFIFYQFQSNIIQNQINEVMGATINQITNKDMAAFKIPFPTDEKEQTAIANVLSDMDKDLEALQQRLHKTQQIKQGMMQELLTGKTRLV